VPIVPSYPTIDAVSRGRTRVVLADHDVLLRKGLASLLGRSGFEVVGQARTPSELIELVRKVRPDKPEG
jgi:DNA-binding NarL/FixJ family response regulator